MRLLASSSKTVQRATLTRGATSKNHKLAHSSALLTAQTGKGTERTGSCSARPAGTNVITPATVLNVLLNDTISEIV